MSNPKSNCFKQQKAGPHKHAFGYLDISVYDFCERTKKTRSRVLKFLCIGPAEANAIAPSVVHSTVQFTINFAALTNINVILRHRQKSNFIACAKMLIAIDFYCYFTNS